MTDKPLNALEKLKQRAISDPTVGQIQFGLIKKGGERTEQMIKDKKPGPDLNYFRVVFFDRFSHYEPVFKSIYGAEPQEFDPVLIMGQTPDEALAFTLERRDFNGQRVSGRCDGLEQSLWFDGNVRHGTLWGDEAKACAAPTPGAKCPLGCKYSGRMYIIPLEFCKAIRRYGYFTLQTGSQEDIVSLYGTLQKAFEIAKTQMTAFKLGRDAEPRHVSWQKIKKKDGEESMIEIKKSLLYLELSEISGDRVNTYLDARISSPTLLTAGAPVGDPALDDDVEDGESVSEITGGKSALPETKTTEAEHWAKSEASQKAIRDRFVRYGFDSSAKISAELPRIEPGVERLRDTKATSLKEYLAWMDARYAPKSEPEIVTEGEIVEDDDPLDLNLHEDAPVPEAETSTWVWTDENRPKFEAKLQILFPDVTPEQILVELDRKSWTMSEAEELALVADLASDKGWRTSTSQIGYFSGKATSYVKFNTAVGVIQFYSTTELIKLVGDGFSRANRLGNLKKLKPDQWDTIERVVIRWEKKYRDSDGTQYLLATDVKPQDDLDEKLKV